MREAHLRDLIAVIDTGSIRSAALKLGISQAAVSKNLTALEKSLGVLLLNRTSKGVAPTEAGLIVLRRARVVDSELRHLIEEMGVQFKGKQKLICVGLSATAEMTLLPMALERFNEKISSIRVSVFGGRSLSNIAALRESKIDFAVGPLPSDQNFYDLDTEQLCSSKLGIVVRAGHPAEDVRSLASLISYGWIYGVNQTSGVLISLLMHKQGLPEPSLVVHCDSSSALVSMLLQSNNVTLSSLDALEPFRAAGILKFLPIEIDLPPIVQYLITPSTRPLTKWAQELADEFRRASRRLNR
jgi:DNA-binding transcriptional LysR family regulator